jgi:hypothetical protein
MTSPPIPAKPNDLAGTRAAQPATLLASWQRYVTETGVVLERDQPINGPDATDLPLSSERVQTALG